MTGLPCAGRSCRSSITRMMQGNGAMMKDITGDGCLEQGKTCWRMARADKMTVIIDAADYFATVRQAMLNAKRSIYLIGWDFDTRITMARPNPLPRVPNKLGKLLSYCVKQNKDLEIYVLRWDLEALHAFGRGMTPLRVLDWITDKRIHFRLDGAHPMASAHHHKIVVIDDVMAFCGGIDMTADRWDTRAHKDREPGRRRPSSKRRYGPWHDVATAFEGDAARILGDLARIRWQEATGEKLPPSEATGHSPWPQDLPAMLEDVDVAISRTAPEYGDQPGIHEIEALYLAAIAAARKTIYLESQYFASRRIAEALARRLREPDGPEIVMINPETADGWLEEEVMGSSRARMLEMIHKADHADRFRIYSPVTTGGKAIYVHAKVMIVDDRFLKVGSSNLNNRSLGFDTECDVSVEVTPALPVDKAAEMTKTILNLRHDLLAEHLGTDIATFEKALQAHDGALIATIESLRQAGKTLTPLAETEAQTNGDSVWAENAFLDPERTRSRWKPLRRMFRRAKGLIGLR